MRFSIAVAVALLAIPVFGADEDDPLGEAVREKVTEHVEFERNRLESIIRRGSRASGPQKAAARRSLESLTPSLGTIHPQFEVGQMGNLSNSPELSVFQVFGNGDILVTVEWSTSPGIATGTRPITSPIGRSSRERHAQLVLLRGFELGEVAVDSAVEFEEYVHVSGTHTYETAIGGSNTVVIIEPLDIEPYLDDRFLRSLGLD